MIAIRRLAAPLSRTEAEALSALHGRAFDGPPRRWGRGWSAVEMSALAESPGVILLAAGDPDLPDGVAIVRAVTDEAELLTIATDPKARRKGVATALLNDAARRLRTLGVTQLFLEVAEKNQVAVSLYNGLGFKRIALRPDYYPFSDSGRDNALTFKLKIEDL